MKIESKRNRFLSVLLCVSIFLSGMAGFGMFNAVFAAETDEPLHFVIRHWHTVTGGGTTQEVTVEGFMTPYMLSYDIYYGFRNTGDYVTSGDGEYIKGMTGSEGHAENVPIQDGAVELVANPYEGIETFAGVSISAGYAATDGYGSGDGTYIRIEYTRFFHLVKGHMFYFNQSRYVSGVDELVSGSMNIGDERDTAVVYLYPDDAVSSDGTSLAGEPIVDGMGQYFTETHKAEAIAYLGELVAAGEVVADVQDDIVLPTIKYYSTAAGLHTDKTAYLASLDSRTFDLSLESWYVGAETASVGMVIDASGSMSYTAEDPVRISIDELIANGMVSEEELNRGIDEYGFLNNDVLDSIMSPYYTNNSILGISNYTYFIFDPRSSVNEYVPLKYWDGTSLEDDTVTSTSIVTRTETLLPRRDSLVGYYGIAQRGLTAPSVAVGSSDEAYYYRDWLLNSVKSYSQADETTGSVYGTYAALVTRRTLSELGTNPFSTLDFVSYRDWLEQHSDSNPWSDGINFADSTGYGLNAKSSLGMYLDASSSIGGTGSDGFTVSFAVQVVSRNSSDKQELLYIGDGNGDDYFKLRRTGTSLSLNQNESDGNTSSLGSVFTQGEWVYLTYVFNNTRNSDGAGATAVTVYRNGEPFTISNSDSNIQALGADLFDGDILYVIVGGLKDESDGAVGSTNLDEFYVFDTPLSDIEVKQLYGFSSGNNSTHEEHRNNSYKTLTDDIVQDVLVGEQAYVKTEKGNVFIVNQSIFDDYIAENDRAGWYYVNFSGNDWDKMYGNAEIGTAQTLYALKPVRRVDSDDVVLDFVYYGSDTPFTNADKDANVDELTYDDNDGYRCTFIEYAPGMVSRSGGYYRDQGVGYSPIRFFVNEEGYLCCFYTASNSGVINDDCYGWAYVCKKDDISRTKVEALQYALGTFTTRLLESSSQSEFSAVRFSAPLYNNGNVSLPEDRLDELVLLDWTSDNDEATDILSYTRGAGTSTSYKDSDERFDSEGNSLGTIRQYNYGLTGGTNTYTGLRAYIENLDPRVKDDTRKYVIIFTDGKDTELTVSSTDEHEMDVAIRQTEAYKLARQLRSEGYTIFTILLSGGTVKEGQVLYDNAVQFLATIAGDTYVGASDEDITAYRHVFVGTDVDSLASSFNRILDAISVELRDYTVQDYIDPRFNLVDADGNQYILNANGEVVVDSAVTTVTTVNVLRDVDGNAVNYNYFSNIAVNGGKVTGLSKDSGIKLVLSYDEALQEEGAEAILFFDSEANLYYLVWEGQTIPGGAEGDSKIPVWNAMVRVRAKDDFIGGNAVLTNGNADGQNYVYKEGMAASSGIDMAGMNGQEMLYPSKGFPRVIVNIPVPDLYMFDSEQLIYEGEILAADGVARMLGDEIRDSMSGQDVSCSLYLDYLERYAVYQNKNCNGTYDLDDPLASIFEEIVEVGISDGSISYDYFYLPNTVNTNQTGDMLHHEADKMGELVFKWEVVMDSYEPYPEDGITKDTLSRRSRLTVAYVPVSVGDREHYDNEIVYDGSAYEWDSDFKPAVGIVTSDDESRLTAMGSYLTDIISGEIHAQLGIGDRDTLDYLIAHYPNRTITYTGNLIRNYGDSVVDSVVGTFTASYVIPSGSSDIVWNNAGFKLNDNYGYVRRYGLSIGTYTLETVSTDAPAGFVFDDGYVVDLADTDASDLFVGYGGMLDGTDAGNHVSVYDADKAAFYNNSEIYLGGYGSGKYVDGRYDNGGTVRRYTDDLFGLYRVDGFMETGSLRVSKTVDDTVSGVPDANASFVFTINLTDGEHPVVGSFAAEGAGYTNVDFDGNGQAVVELRHGESVVINGLPAGTGYVVTEASSDTYSQDVENSVGTGGSVIGGQVVEAKFVNIYSANGTLNFSVRKQIEGRSWNNNDYFRFVVAADALATQAIKDGVIVMPSGYAADIDSDGNYVYTVFADSVDAVPFGEIRFTNISGNDSWTFTVSEYQDADRRDLIYDNTVYTLDVKVSENETKDGNLNVDASFASSGTASDEDDLSMVFTNRSYVNWTLGVNKVLAGRDWTYGDIFRFEIVQTDGNICDIGNAESCVDGRSGFHTASFGTITFRSEGEYVFEVKESVSDEIKDGIVVDDTVYTVRVVVGVDSDGELSVNKVVVVKNGSETEYGAVDANDVVLDFMNVYTANGIVSVPVTIDKNIEGREWQDVDFFDFELVPDMNNALTKAAVGAGQISVKPAFVTVRSDAPYDAVFGISFSDIRFGGSNERTYSFILREVVPEDANGFIYSSVERPVSVTLRDNGVGGFTAEVTGNEEVFVVTNTYEYQSVDMTVSVNKGIDGRDWQQGDSFSFVINRTGGNDSSVLMPENNTVTVGYADNGHTDRFGSIVFSKPGTYSFEVSELKSNVVLMTDDSIVRKFKVVVADDYKGNLYIRNVLAVSGIGSADVLNADDAKVILNFVNTYTSPAPVKYSMDVSKTLMGRPWLVGDVFEFEWLLVDAPENVSLDLPQVLRIGKGTNESSTYSGVFGTVGLSEPGEYVFKVREKTDGKSNDGIGYDTTEYTVYVTVSSAASGSLVAETTRVERNGIDYGTDNVMSFVNTYSASTVWPPVVHKNIEGRDWFDTDRFEFKLELQDAVPAGNAELVEIPEASISISNEDADFTKAFADVKFNAEGTYTFTLSEVGNNVNGIACDDTVYVIEIEVTDESHNGVLVPSVRVVTMNDEAYDSEVFEFTNVYSAVGELPEGSVSVTKVLEGRNWSDSDSFSFMIDSAENYGDAVKMFDTVVTVSGADSDRTGAFGRIAFSEAGVYRFNIFEVKGSDENMTYDDSVHTLVVTVTDNLDGTLTVKTDDGTEFVFVNTYEEPVVTTPGETITEVTTVTEVTVETDVVEETTVTEASVTVTELDVSVSEETTVATTVPVESEDNVVTGVMIGSSTLVLVCLSAGAMILTSKKRRK